MSKAPFIAKRLSPISIELLRQLKTAGCLEEWETRKTVQANRWDLLCLKKNKLALTPLGKRVAALL
jgi:hypothetical protein